MTTYGVSNYEDTVKLKITKPVRPALLPPAARTETDEMLLDSMGHPLPRNNAHVR